MKSVRLGPVAGLAFLCSCSALFGDRGSHRPSPVDDTDLSPPIAGETDIPRWIRPTRHDFARSPGLVEAISLLGHGEVERAAIHLQQVRSIGGFGSEVTALHAWALAEAEEVAAAEAVVQEGIARFGATPALGYAMAVVFELQDRPAEALPLYRDLVTLAPDDAAMLAACARTAVGARRGEEALQYLDRWMLAAPLDIDGKRLRAKALQLSGRPDDALALYRQIVNAWPQDYVLLGEMAAAAFETAEASGRAEHFELAVELLQQLTEADPQHASAFLQLGRALSFLGRDTAAAALRRCLELEPGRVAAGLELSDLLAASGDSQSSAAVLLDLLRQPLAAMDVEAVQSALLELR